jgi:LmbE family N-acetylglucosaminyl deacetylase
MSVAPDHLVLSPHPDDAVWSLGGCLARWRSFGETCTVVTIFDGDPGPMTGDAGPVTPSGELDWRRIAEPSARRAEDRRALAALDCAGISLGLPDAALRSSAPAGEAGDAAVPRYRSARRLFGPVHPDDEMETGRLRDLLEPLVATAGAVHVPLAAGHHVDHRLVRSALSPLRPAEVQWYEDFPYPLDARDHAGMVPVTEPLDPADVRKWVTAAAEHASQAEALLGGTEALRQRLTARAARDGSQIGAVAAARQWRRVPG